MVFYKKKTLFYRLFMLFIDFSDCKVLKIKIFNKHLKTQILTINEVDMYFPKSILA